MIKYYIAHAAHKLDYVMDTGDLENDTEVIKTLSGLEIPANS